MVSFLKNPSGNTMTHILLSLDTLKLWVVSLLINTFNFLYYCLQGSYVFSYTINKLSCLSVLLNNTEILGRHFHNAFFFFCFLFNGKKANRNLRGMADSWSNINKSKPTDKWLTREPLLTVTQWWGQREKHRREKTRTETEAAEQGASISWLSFARSPDSGKQGLVDRTEVDRLRKSPTFIRNCMIYKLFKLCVCVGGSYVHKECGKGH